MEDVRNEIAARRKEMRMTMSNALALMRWRDSRFSLGGFTSGDIAWLLIGALLAVLVIWGLSRRRRRWL